MLTVDFERLPVWAGQRVLDLGCGEGRHTFELARRGCEVVAFDRDVDALDRVAALLAAMRAAGELPADGHPGVVAGDALALPFPDGAFDAVVASEVLEHLPADVDAVAEISRVTRRGGHVVVTVPRCWPEAVCWALSRAYHSVDGGHVRIYRRGTLLGRLRAGGLRAVDSHHAHALHAPYWWLRCAVGVDRDVAPTRWYRRFLEWDLQRRPPATRTLEAALNPLLGKSLVVYLRTGGTADAAS